MNNEQVARVSQVFIVILLGLSCGFIVGHAIPGEENYSVLRQGIADQRVTGVLAGLALYVYWRRLYRYETADEMDRLWTQRGAIVLCLGLILDKGIFWPTVSELFMLKSQYYRFVRYDLGFIQSLGSLLMWVGLMLQCFPWTLRVLKAFWWLPFAVVPAIWGLSYMASGLYL